MIPEISTDPYTQYYGEMFIIIGRNNLVIKNTTDPIRLARLEFLCEEIVFNLKETLQYTPAEQWEKQAVLELVIELAERSLQLVKARVTYTEKVGKIDGVKKKKTISLEQLFKSQEDFQKSLDILFKTEKPVLGPSGNFLVGVRIRKQAITAWLRTVIIKNKIEIDGLNIKEQAQVLNNYFKNLNLDGRTINSQNRGIQHEEYFTDFQILLK